MLLPGIGGVVPNSGRAAITGMKTWGGNNAGYANNQGRLITLTLKASNTDPASNSWSGTTIGSIAQFSNTWATNQKQTLGNANSTRYRYVWLEEQIDTSDLPFLCELQFFETLNGAEAAIDPTGKTIINSGFGTRTTAAFDGNTNQDANSSTSGSSTTIARIGLDLGA